MKRQTIVLAAIASLTAAIPSLGHADGELHLFNWTDYTSPEMIAKFEKETGTKVTIDTYDSNETALAKLSSGASGYDAIIISNDFVPIFVAQGLLQKVDVASMANFKNVDPEWQKRPWDAERRIHRAVGLGHDVLFGRYRHLQRTGRSAQGSVRIPSEDMKGKIGMFGSPSEVMSLALVYLGKEQCNSNPDDLKALDALLEAQKPFVKVYNSDGNTERQVSGETVMHEQWSGKALASRAAEGDHQVCLPQRRRRSAGWTMSRCRPMRPNLDNAKAFLNFLMDPENIALQQKSTGYQSAIAGSNKFLPAEFGDSPEFNPPADLKITFAPACDEKATRAYDKIWTELRQ